jgi:hypothetical protein
MDYFIGQLNYSPSSTKTICKIDVWFAAEIGNADSRTFTLKIWSLTGANLNTVVSSGTSNPIAGSTISAPQWVTFDGLNATLNSGTSYAITVDGGAVDASNYFTCYVGATTITGTFNRWDSAGTSYGGVWDHDFCIKLYE